MKEERWKGGKQKKAEVSDLSMTATKLSIISVHKSNIVFLTSVVAV